MLENPIKSIIYHGLFNGNHPKSSEDISGNNKNEDLLLETNIFYFYLASSDWLYSLIPHLGLPECGNVLSVTFTPDFMFIELMVSD